MTTRLWPEHLYRAGQTTGVLTAAAMVVLTISDVCMRYFFNKAIFGAPEIINAMLGVLVGAGLIVVAGHRIHICVDLFDQPLRRVFPIGYLRWIYTCEVLGTAALAFLLARHAWHTVRFGELTAVLEFPIGWVYAVIAVLTFAALAVLLSGWRVPTHHESDTQ